MKIRGYILSTAAVSTIILVMLAGKANAQIKNYNEEITVVAPFDPIIPDAFKVSQNPAIDDTVTTVPTMNYSVMPRMADVKPTIDPLPAVKLVAEPLSKLYRNYIKAGAGNYASLFGELYMSSLRSRQYHAAVRLKHQSASGSMDEYGPAANSRNEADVTATKYFDEYILSGKLNYKRDGFHLYGFKPTDFPDTLVEKDDLKQWYQTFGINTTLASNYKAKDELNHSFGLAYYHMAGLNKIKENNLKITATFDKRYDLLHLEEDQVLGINAGYNFLNQNDTSGHINSGIFLLNPFIKATYKEYSFMAGFKLYISNDSVTKANFYPVAEAKLELIPGALKLFAGIGGGMERSTLQYLTTQNQYLSAIVPWNYIYDDFNINGGFQSNISRSFNFNGRISASTYENYPLFITDTSAYLLNSFTVLYDNVSTVSLKGELEFVKSARLRLAVNGTYTHYKTYNEEYAWYKPTYVFEFSGRYDIQNKIIFTASATVNGSVWAQVPQLLPENHMGISNKNHYAFEAQKLDGWVDINLGTEYRFTKALSFWLNFNNLSGSKYFKYYNYRSYGFNLLGGVSYSF